MSSLKEIIPAVYFTKPPVSQDLTHGQLSVTRSGKILARWEKRSKVFNENLEAARKLKVSGFGTYKPEEGGWIFQPEAAKQADAEFPDTLVRTPEFKALLALKSEEPKAPTAPLNKPSKHGKITKQGNHFLVQWGGTAGNCPSSSFQKYLASARTIKANSAGSVGWNKFLNGWLLATSAAQEIATCFPESTFDHCPELVSLVGQAKPLASQDKPLANESNSLTANLLKAADDIFSDFE